MLTLNYLISLFFSFLAALNTGAVLWFQQLYSMLLKRVIHAVRSPVVMALEILLPIGGIFVAMVFAVAIGSRVRNDPIRTLTIASSAEQSVDLTLFYAQFGNSTGLNLNVSKNKAC